MNHLSPEQQMNRLYEMLSQVLNNQEAMKRQLDELKVEVKYLPMTLRLEGVQAQLVAMQMSNPLSVNVEDVEATFRVGLEGK